MIRQFSVVRTPEGGRGALLVVVLQSHWTELPTTLVAPLRTFMAFPAPDGVLVPVDVDGQDYLLDLALMANVLTERLGRPLASLAAYEDVIRRGLDRLFTGF